MDPVYIQLLEKHDFFENNVLKNKYVIYNENYYNVSSNIYFIDLIESGQKDCLFKVKYNSEYYLLKGIKNNKELTENEIHILEKLKLKQIKNVPKIINSSVVNEEENNVSAIILMDYSNFENLVNFYKNFSQKQSILIFLKTISILHELHQNNIYFKKICENSILINKNNMDVFLYDFSYATDHPSKFKSYGKMGYKSKEQILEIDTKFGSDWFSLVLVMILTFFESETKREFNEIFNNEATFYRQLNFLSAQNGPDLQLQKYNFAIIHWEKYEIFVEKFSKNFDQMGNFVKQMFLSLKQLTNTSEIENENKNIQKLFQYLTELNIKPFVYNELADENCFIFVNEWLESNQNRVEFAENADIEMERVLYY